MELIQDLRKIEIECPICRQKRLVPIPIVAIQEPHNPDGTTTLRIPANFACEHMFCIDISPNFEIQNTNYWK
jgi:hypothetical protein